MSDKKSVLFICIHNSARSQMAEEFLKMIGSEMFDVQSAGLEPGTINPYVVKAMNEVGVDLSSKKTKGVKDVFKLGDEFDYIISVCDRSIEKDCPTFPQETVQLNWTFPDPEKLTGTEEEILQKVCEIRDVIKMEIEQFVASFK